MPFLDSLDIANRACQHCGVAQISSPTEDSLRKTEISMAYDKVRRAELRANVWRFAIRRTVLRAYTTTTLLLVPGAYTAGQTYLPGEIVTDTNGLYWISEKADNVNNSPGGNNDAWEMFFGPKSVNAYDSTLTYSAGELVYVVTGAATYQVYRSLINANSDVPGTATAYDATVQYKQDDAVSYLSVQYRSLLPINVGNTPNTSPTAWSSTPTLTVSSMNWRPLVATLQNAVPTYPIGTGPTTQNETKNIFRLPVGFLREAPQNPKAGAFSRLGFPGNDSFNDWIYEGNFIVSADAGPLVFRFVADVTRVASMDDMFAEGLGCRIAAEVCVRLTQSDAKLQTIASAYKMFMGDAKRLNAIEQGAVDAPLDDFIACRS